MSDLSPIYGLDQVQAAAATPVTTYILGLNEDARWKLKTALTGRFANVSNLLVLPATEESVDLIRNVLTGGRNALRTLMEELEAAGRPEPTQEASPEERTLHPVVAVDRRRFQDRGLPIRLSDDTL